MEGSDQETADGSLVAAMLLPWNNKLKRSNATSIEEEKLWLGKCANYAYSKGLISGKHKEHNITQ